MANVFNDKTLERLGEAMVHHWDEGLRTQRIAHAKSLGMDVATVSPTWPAQASNSTYNVQGGLNWKTLALLAAALLGAGGVGALALSALVPHPPPARPPVVRPQVEDPPPAKAKVQLFYETGDGELIPLGDATGKRGANVGRAASMEAGQ